MTDSLERYLMERLREREKEGRLRKLPSGNSPLIDFASNDYLGLARSEALWSRIETASAQFRRNGSTGSRLLTGNSDAAASVEEYLAGIFRAEATLLFNSGYAANLAVLSALPGRGDTLLMDELVHASIKDGARLSLARRFSFRHNDLGDLEKKLRAAKGRKYVVVESFYSMDGDECPLRELVSLAAAHDATVILDEAHSTGVVGEGGAGLAVRLGLADNIAVRIYTFGKAMGLHGACVAGRTPLRDFLVNFSRPFIYTTAMSPHSVVAIREAFAFLGENIALQSSLADNIAAYLSETKGLAGGTSSTSAIQTLIVPGNEAVSETAQWLRREGVDARPIMSPTVPQGLERIRICLHAFNTAEEIGRLTALVRELNLKQN